MGTKTEEPPHSSGSIDQCLAQMVSDATEIEKRLLEAPLSLVGEGEPSLYDIIQRVKVDLERARQIWFG